MVGNTSRRPFVLVANHMVLDFVNTVNARPSFTRDDLTCADDLVDWACAAGLVDRAGDETLRRAADASQLAAAVILRESLYHVFGPIAGGHDPVPEALTCVTDRAAAAIGPARWIRGDSGFAPSWSGDSIDSICDRLADEAVQLLRSPAVWRIGSCAGCGWLFLDTSRAHARRWCSMNACGVRNKMRRYHQRQASSSSV